MKILNQAEEMQRSKSHVVGQLPENVINIMLIARDIIFLHIVRFFGYFINNRLLLKELF